MLTPRLPQSALHSEQIWTYLGGGDPVQAEELGLCTWGITAGTLYKEGGWGPVQEPSWTDRH